MTGEELYKALTETPAPDREPVLEWELQAEDHRWGGSLGPFDPAVAFVEVDGDAFLVRWGFTGWKFGNLKDAQVQAEEMLFARAEMARQKAGAPTIPLDDPTTSTRRRAARKIEESEQ